MSCDLRIIENKKRAAARQKARRFAHRMKQLGKIIPATACERCGCTPKPIIRCNGVKQSKLEMHHPDHTKPLVVVWLCSACHHQEHDQYMVSNEY